MLRSVALDTAETVAAAELSRASASACSALLDSAGLRPLHAMPTASALGLPEAVAGVIR